MDESSWIADGTEAEEPITTETPIEAEEVVEAVAEEVVAEPVAEIPETVEEIAQAFIDAKLGDDPYQLPENVLLPLKRGDSVEYKPVMDVLREGMLKRDYDEGRREQKERERALEARTARIEAEQARFEERAKFLAEREEEIKGAMTDPAKWAAYQDHLKQYQSNPIYRNNVDKALAQRETEAELATYREREDERVKSEAVSHVRGWIEDMAAQYPGVDPNRVARVYGSALSNGQAALDRAEVQRVFQAEATYLEQSMSPLQAQLAEMKATLDAMQAEKAAEQHNETTAHALNRAKTPRVATGNAAPVQTPVPATKFGPNELSERNAAWARSG